MVTKKKNQSRSYLNHLVYTRDTCVCVDTCVAFILLLRGVDILCGVDTSVWF